MTTTNSTERNPVLVPRYTYLDAARYLQIPLWVMFQCKQVLHYPIGYYPPDFYTDGYETPHKQHSINIAFNTFAVLFVFSTIYKRGLKPFSINILDWHHLIIRPVLENSYVASTVNFVDPDQFYKHFIELFSWFPDSDLAGLHKSIAIAQDRIEVQDGLPVRLYPFSRDIAPDAPRTVVIDPEIRFGRPTVKGVPTDILAERWHAGDSSQDLADDYGLALDVIEEALRYESLISMPRNTLNLAES